MRYAEVSVNSPIAQRQTFSYAIPPGLTVETGQAVLVPFGDKLLQGVVLELAGQPAVEKTKDIAGVIEPRPILSPHHLQLARWISDYYLSPLFDAVALMLPPGFERRPLTFISARAIPDDLDLATLTPEQQQVLKLLEGQEKVGLKKIERALGKRKAQAAVAQLIKIGLAARSYELERIRAKPKIEPYLRLATTPEEARREADSLKEKGAERQADLLEFLLKQDRPVPWAEARKNLNSSKAVADALVNKGLAAFEQVEVRRDPLAGQVITTTQPLTPTEAQRSALEAINSALAGGKERVFLLHGVTGSGKTEVYLQALAETVKMGKRGIVLVPEIALTPQTIERFAARFPGRVAVLHSQLSLGEQFDEWQRIRNSEFDVVIGPRSAVFAPQPDLGLIVIDEEHEWSYKQSDKSPRYHARDVALKLAELSGAVVVLGSATPDVESCYHARKGDYKLLELPGRVTPRDGTALPQVEIVDMREELKAGVRGLFSRSLAEAISQAVTSDEQVILFLNRRGAATFIQCRGCGFVLRCQRCDVPLTYHLAEESLVCHQCNRRSPVPESCPRCKRRDLKFLGLGTQKLEQEAGYNFPTARLLRWDTDVTRGRYSHDAILSKFRGHQADILIGTQMVAKGLDLPLVTLVGVVSADTALNLPDFRAGERTFQLLSQVAGRAGRGVRGGRVIIQSYTPEHYAIQAAAQHDYAAFYNKEIDYRRQLRNPPFSRLACLTYSHIIDILCRREAERMKRLLAQEIDSKGIADIELIGPAPAFIQRRRGKFRWQLILRGRGLAEFLSPVPFPQGWVVDIDPVGLG
jgi:primosomal protein N' (replication factor Y)